MVAAGELGRLVSIHASYIQDWLTRPIDADGQKQAEWRTDPARSGQGGCIGDIGTHAFQLAHFVTGVQPSAVLADLSTFVPGRRVDDNAQILLRYQNGARGALWASQVAPGNENGLKLRVYGEKGGLEWTQADPNYLWYTPFGEPKRLLTRGGAGAGAAAGRVTRVPPGHPEGYLEAFANVYRNFAAQVRAHGAGANGDPAPRGVPGIKAALRGMAFIETVVAASKSAQKWHAFPSIAD